MFEAQLRPDPQDDLPSLRHLTRRGCASAVQLVVLVPLQLLALPFALIWSLLSPLTQRIRFPFDRKEILNRVEKSIGSRQEATLYLQGLIDGYFRPRTSWPSADPRQRPFHDGVEDGTALKQNRLTIEDLPTRMQPYPDLSEFTSTDSEFVSLGSCFENSMAATAASSTATPAPTKKAKAKSSREKLNA